MMTKILQYIEESGKAPGDSDFPKPMLPIDYSANERIFVIFLSWEACGADRQGSG